MMELGYLVCTDQVHKLLIRIDFLTKNLEKLKDEENTKLRGKSEKLYDDYRKIGDAHQVYMKKQERYLDLVKTISLIYHKFSSLIDELKDSASPLISENLQNLMDRIERTLDGLQSLTGNDRNTHYMKSQMRRIKAKLVTLQTEIKHEPIDVEQPINLTKIKGVMEYSINVKVNKMKAISKLSPEKNAAMPISRKDHLKPKEPVEKTVSNAIRPFVRDGLLQAECDTVDGEIEHYKIKVFELEEYIYSQFPDDADAESPEMEYLKNCILKLEFELEQTKQALSAKKGPKSCLLLGKFKSAREARPYVAHLFNRFIDTEIKNASNQVLYDAQLKKARTHELEVQMLTGDVRRLEHEIATSRVRHYKEVEEAKFNHEDKISVLAITCGTIRVKHLPTTD
ncbi:hypothetical protein CDAR_270681 [Caerostris darwini]|uniref:Uncharacterized protein n=1 Tax=Caerostris darwini TaxID=1538125 RepID=A0AAV4TF87_9ARAC|nr:hypothetical protein CDAR_270681 [Caerostris darwini]